MRDELWRARQAVGLRETGLRKMADRHARERMQKEQELQAARARLRLVEQEAGIETVTADDVHYSIDDANAVLARLAAWARQEAEDLRERTIREYLASRGEDCE